MASKFVYVTYIRTTPQKLWEALTKPEFTRQYFFGVTMDSDWKAGSPWKMTQTDGSISDAGEVIESDPPKHLVLKWRNEFPNLRPEGFTRCAFDISAEGDLTKLQVVHEADMDNSKTIAAVSDGWPKILSSLKSMLETGTPIALKPGSSNAARAAVRAAG
jgi:uncharacterized protein YndB with AHSA1/START domain